MSGTEPAPFGESGAAVLNESHRVLTTFCVLPSREAADAIVLWCACTHALPAFTSAPRLAITSATKQTGKSRTLDAIEGMSYRPLAMMNATVAAVFRSLNVNHPPTLIFDEVDTIFGTQRVAEQNEELRGLLNAGFQRGRVAVRCVGPKQKPTEFKTFAMVAMAGIGGLPDTITDRAINIHMRRRKQSERVQPFRERRDRPTLDAVRTSLGDWLNNEETIAKLQRAEPDMRLSDGSTLEDRPADVWEPLIAVADLAGDDWPTRVRAAALALTRAAADDDEQDNLPVRLLRDIRGIWDDKLSDFITSKDLVVKLRMIEDGPWAEKDTELTMRRLATELKQFRVAPRHDATKTMRGYHREDFADVFERWLTERTAG